MRRGPHRWGGDTRRHEKSRLPFLGCQAARLASCRSLWSDRASRPSLTIQFFMQGGCRRPVALTGLLTHRLVITPTKRPRWHYRMYPKYSPLVRRRCNRNRAGHSTHSLGFIDPPGGLLSAIPPHLGGWLSALRPRPQHWNLHRGASFRTVDHEPSVAPFSRRSFTASRHLLLPCHTCPISSLASGRVDSPKGPRLASSTSSRGHRQTPTAGAQSLDHSRLGD